MNATFDPSAIAIEDVRIGDAATVAEVDAWVLSQPESTPFHRPAWIFAVARGNGQRAILLVARDVTGAIVGVLPLVLIRSALFGRALVSSGFAVDGGILAVNSRAETALADTCWALAQAHGCSTAELRGGPAPDGWTVKADAYLGFAKPLEASDEAQLLSIPRRHRAEVRKSLENGLSFEMGRDKRLRDTHYRLYAASVHRLGTPVFPRAMFEHVLDGFGDAADIALVTKDGRSAVVGREPVSS